MNIDANEIYKRIVSIAGTNDFARSDSDAEDKSVISNILEKLDNVFILSDTDDLLQQREDYPDYIQDADLGDPVYFDGEAICCKQTIEDWVERPEKGVLYTFSEYADLLLYPLILEKMELMHNVELTGAARLYRAASSD